MQDRYFSDSGCSTMRPCVPQKTEATGFRLFVSPPLSVACPPCVVLFVPFCWQGHWRLATLLPHLLMAPRCSCANPTLSAAHRCRNRPALEQPAAAHSRFQCVQLHVFLQRHRRSHARFQCRRPQRCLFCCQPAAQSAKPQPWPAALRKTKPGSRPSCQLRLDS